MLKRRYFIAYLTTSEVDGISGVSSYGSFLLETKTWFAPSPTTLLDKQQDRVANHQGVNKLDVVFTAFNRV